MTILDLIRSRVPVIYDGATGTEIQKHDYSIDDLWGKRGCNEILNITRPEILRSIHTSYFAAGAHIAETNTFGGNRAKLAEFGMEKHLAEINSAAVRIVKEAAVEAGNAIPRFVSGSMGPTGFILSSSDKNLASISFEDCAAIFEEQAYVLTEAGADVLLLETMQDLLEVRAGIVGCRRAFAKLGRTIPLQVQATMDQAGHMLLGSDVSAFLGAVANFGVEIIGFNCSTGPAEMDALVSKVLSSCDLAVSMVPNAGMPENVDGKAFYRMNPEPFGAYVANMVAEKGVSVVGGCCGTTPEHIAALSRALAGKSVAERAKKGPTCFIATGISGKALHDEVSPFVVGERLNAQGSKKTKELILANDLDELYQLGLEQIEKGSAVLDLCVAINERDDEAPTMAGLVKHLSERLAVPLCVDSTDPAVFEAALRASPGSVLINSINLEHTGDKARRILALARDFACPVIALPIDDEGMAKTVERKLALTQQLVDIACGEFGLPIHFIHVDPLVFTLATGDAETATAALDSLEALRLIKKTFPGIRTAMGVSNVSFGLSPAARRVLNNLMLHHAGEAGLDAAIFNPLHRDSYDSITADVRVLGENLLFNRSPAALGEFVAHFEALAAAKKPALAKGPVVALSPSEELSNKVLKRDKRDLAALIEKVLETTSATDILNTILLPAMALVGEKMATGEMILPFVLQSAEVMREAVVLLDPHFKTGEGTVKGTMLIATVYGDVHDIGKNLVASIIRNQGYTVIDLGKQVALPAIIAAVEEHKPAAVGLSALLVTTSREMAACVQAFADKGWTVPIIIGGAAVNAAYAERIGVCLDGSRYAGGVYFARDAFDAVKILEGKRGASETVSPATVVETIVAPAEELEYEGLMEAPFLGTGEVLVWDPAAILRGLDKDRLYNAWWKGGKLSGKAREEAFDEFDDVFAELVGDIMNGELLEPRGFYGFFPVFTMGTELVVLDPADATREVAHFSFPRVARAGGRSVVDYFRPESDVLPVQVVTIGNAIAERCAKYFREGDEYAKGFYLNALAGFITEVLAEKVSVQICQALLIPRTQGRRMSFGYPGMPETTAHSEFFEMTAADDRLSLELTAAGQIVPEHSTAAIYVHHPKVTYLG